MLKKIFLKYKLEPNLKIHMAILFFFVLLSFASTFYFLGINDELILSTDGMFHFNRFNYIYQNVSQGTFNNSMYNSYLHEMGYPLGFFYPQLLLYPFALLSFLGISSTLAFKIIIGTMISGSAISMYSVAYKIAKKELVSGKFYLLGVFSAILYAFVPILPFDGLMMSYVFINAFIRMTIGELIAFVFFPIIFYGLYLIFKKESGYKILVTGIVGVIYSHTLSLFMVAIVIIFYCLLNFRIILKNKEIFKELLLSLALALLLGVFQLLPMLEMMLHQDYLYNIPLLNKAPLHKMVIFQIQSLISRKLNWQMLFFQIFLGLGIITMIYSLKGLYFKFIGIGFFAFYMVTDLFPWYYLSETPMSIIQFPFRFAFLFILLIGFGVPGIIQNKIKPIFLNCFLCLLLTMSMAANIVSLNASKQIVDSTNYNTSNLKYGTVLEIGSGMEYIPGNFDIKGYSPKTGLNRSVLNKQLQELIILAEKDDYLLPKFYYKGYKIKKGTEIIPYIRSEFGLIQTLIPVKESEVIIEYVGTPIQKISFSITLVSVIWIVVSALNRKKAMR